MEPADLLARIAALVASNPGQMSADEYLAVARAVIARRPASMLVFGCGRDSLLWADLVPAGCVLLFVENDPRWAQDCPRPVLLTRYHGVRTMWQRADPLEAMEAWPVLARSAWDLVLVDGPRGDRDTAPGRLGPIAFASGQKSPARPSAGCAPATCPAAAPSPPTT
jgi:hypothetical protein